MAYKDMTVRIAHVNAYNKEKYDRVTILLPKDERAKLQAYAKTHGESMNAYLLRLVREDMANAD